MTKPVSRFLELPPWLEPKALDPIQSVWPCPPGVDPDAFSRQILLEHEQNDLGVARYMRRLAWANQKGTESKTPFGRDLVEENVLEVAKSLKEWVQRASKRADGRGGACGMAHGALKTINLETAAFIGLSTLIDGVSLDRSLQNAAYSIGARIEDEQRFKKFQGDEKLLYSRLKDLADVKTTYAMKTAFLKNRMEHYEVEWEDWTQNLKIHVGMKIIDTIIMVGRTKGDPPMPIFEIGGGERLGKKQLVLKIKPTQYAVEWITAHTNHWRVMDPVFMPTVCPPKRWTNVWSGGYYTDRGRQTRLVKKQSTAYFKDLQQTDLSRVFTALNALQDTAWAVNTKVLEVAREVYEWGSGKAGLPQKNDDPMPTKPHDIDTNEQAKRLWKMQATEVYKANATRRSKCFQTAQTLWLGERFRNELAIYYPYNLDFRGRAYALPMFMHPQGNDLARGLIHFSEGKELGDEMARDWLAIHGANLWGHDKVAFADRVMWVLENEEKIIRSAEHPLDYHWWMDADGGEKPWQFLAFCFEWSTYKKEGLAFKSRLPIALDGSCNGLQHFSAMLRDPVGGAAVNLLPAETPQDIYQRVAEVVLERLEREKEKNPYAAGWIAFGITRKITKRPVMVLPYGGTRYSCQDYVEMEVQEQIRKGKPNPFGDQLPLATKYLASTVWTSIGKVVVAAVEVMEWLKQIASVYSKAKLPIIWVTPIGFTVYQKYLRLIKGSLDVHTECAGRMNLRIRGLGTKVPIDAKQQRNGLSPNFVHSLDASAMMLTILRAQEDHGMDAFAMIHDSFGTHAADTTKLFHALRQEFVVMYQQNDPIGEMDLITRKLVDTESPTAPAKSSLDLDEALASEFFFA